MQTINFTRTISEIKNISYFKISRQGISSEDKKIITVKIKKKRKIVNTNYPI